MSNPDPPIRILVVDDDPDLRDLIGMRLTSVGYAVSLADSGLAALARFHAEQPRAVITDLRMDGMDGHALFERLHAEAPSVPVIILTAHGTIPDAVLATQRGVFGFLTKPFDGRELLDQVAAAVALSPPITPVRADGAWRREIITASPQMDELLRNARRVAEIDVSLLLLGPNGSGKELLARAIHAASPRRNEPFHILHCDATEDGGVEKQFAAALTAVRQGTLFLKNISLLDATTQARLLPLVGEAGLFGRTPPRARIIAASPGSLEPGVRAGEFRADTYYCLARHTLVLPPLAERREDIPLLVAHFTAAATAADNHRRGFAPDALALLCESPWPGNVAQLHNLVLQALTFSTSAQVPVSVVRRLLAESNERDMSALDEARRVFEYDYLVRLLQSTAGNVSQAARIAQRNRTEFYKLLSRHAIDPAAFKTVSK